MTQEESIRNSKEQALTAERVREALDYSPETGRFTNKIDRSRALRGASPETTQNYGYRVVNLYGRPYLAHRLAWLYVYGCWPNKQIDHIDGNRTNNRISNLRDVSNQLNTQNVRKARASSKSGILGVVLDRSGRWISQICANGKKVHLGRFGTPEEASQAYLAAKSKLHQGSTI